MSPTTKAVAVAVPILAVVTVALLLLVSWQLHGYKEDGVTGWSLAFDILTSAASPFGTSAGGWAVLLSLWGFLLVPALAGAVAGIVLGAVISSEQGKLDRFVDRANQSIAAIKAKGIEKQKQKAKAKAAKTAGHQAVSAGLGPETDAG